MRIITFKDITSLNISPATSYNWAKELVVSKPQSIVPIKTSIKRPDGVFFTSMPSFVSNQDGKQWGGVKVVTRYPSRVPSLDSRILLANAETGEFLAIMDGTWITAMRTGALSALSTMLFAKKDFSTMGFMGLGNVSRSMLLHLLEEIGNRELNIKLLKYKEQEEDFARRFTSYRNVKFTFVDTPDEMARETEVIISGATYLPDNVCSNDSFCEGVFLQPIHTLGFTNCDLFFDKVFVDDIAHVSNFRNFDRFRSVTEVSSVLNGDKPGRESNHERILAYNIGISTYDVGFAAKIYETLQTTGVLDTLPECDFKEPDSKFWV